MWMPGYDAWLTNDLAMEKWEERAEYCEEHHPEFEGLFCPLCEEEERDEGPDPDRQNDERREREEEERDA